MSVKVLAVDISAKSPNVADRYVSDRIKSIRSQMRISQEELARRIGVTFQQVQKYEAGTNRVSAGRLFQIAGALDTPILRFYPRSIKLCKEMRSKLLFGSAGFEHD